MTDVMLQELMSGNKELDQQVRIIIFSNEFCSNSITFNNIFVRVQYY